MSSSPLQNPTPLAPNERVRPYADAPRIPEGEVIDPRELVGAKLAPVELEIGPGRGGFVFERLAAEPKLFFLGLEIRRKWATIVDRRLAASEHAGRGRVFAEDARSVLPRFVAGSIARAFVHFPDPWWKKRHHKRMVIGAPLLDELVRVLAPGGELFIQTDVEERAASYEALCNACSGLMPAPGGPRIAENPFGARSPREKRAQADGLPIYRLLYRREA
ncbi:MAG TPA: tRNA (guanine-N7)-methyltransferase [Polyangiaceae bacterium]|nr:tRNA (guanine-N7)-methyltransferase [Polyangiaceae bacterium]